MPVLFHCLEHRAPGVAQACGPDCWRCEIRETLWVAHREANPELPEDRPPLATRRAGKMRGALANLPAGFRRYVLQPQLDYVTFRNDAACNNNARGVALSGAELSSTWKTILFWRENVEAH